MRGRGRRQDRQHDADKASTQAAAPSQLNVQKYAEEIIQRTIPTDVDLQRRTVLLNKLSGLVAKGLANHKELQLLPFGSCVLGLDTPSSDLDLTLNGTLHLATSNKGAHVVCEARDLGQEDRVMLLRALRGRVRIDKHLKERAFVPHARVPVLKFNYQENPELQPLLCDVSVANIDGVWKSNVLRHLLQIDVRAAQLARLVKLWAKWQGINDPTSGTFNSYALMLMVIWLLQNTPVHPILPPINALLNVDADEARPMDGNSPPPPGLDQKPSQEVQKRALTFQGYGDKCPASVWELFGIFLHAYWSMATLWVTYEYGDRLRVCPWDGLLDGARWTTNCYCVGVEDPFNAEDNAARTVSEVKRVVNAFQSSRHAYYAASVRGMEAAALFRLFGPAVVEDQELAAASASLKSEIMAMKIGPCVPPEAAEMHPLVKEAIELEYRHKAGPVLRAAEANAARLQWEGPVRRIHHVVQGRMQGHMEDDEEQEEAEIAAVTASIGVITLAQGAAST